MQSQHSGGLRWEVCRLDFSLSNCNLGKLCLRRRKIKEELRKWLSLKVLSSTPSTLCPKLAFRVWVACQSLEDHESFRSPSPSFLLPYAQHMSLLQMKWESPGISEQVVGLRLLCVLAPEEPPRFPYWVPFSLWGLPACRGQSGKLVTELGLFGQTLLFWVPVKVPCLTLLSNSVIVPCSVVPISAWERLPSLGSSVLCWFPSCYFGGIAMAGFLRKKSSLSSKFWGVEGMVCSLASRWRGLETWQQTNIWPGWG